MVPPPRPTLKARLLHKGMRRKSPMRLRKAFDKMLPKPPCLVLAQSWLWSNPALKIGLGAVFAASCVLFPRLCVGYASIDFLSKF